MPGSIAVVDDHPLFREGVARTLAEHGFDVVAEGASAADALRIVLEISPDILLLDLSLPGGGLEGLRAIRSQRPDQKVVMLTVSEHSDDVLRALKAGAQGYVLKGIGSAALADILTGIAAGKRYVAPSLSAELLSRPGPDERAETDGVPPSVGLTEREQEVMEHLARGRSNKLIARELGLQEKTIKHHLTRIMEKLSVSNRTEAALAWREMQLSPLVREATAAGADGALPGTQRASTLPQSLG